MIKIKKDNIKLIHLFDLFNKKLTNKIAIDKTSIDKKIFTVE